MADMNVTTSVESLRVLFSQMKEVLYVKDANKTLAQIASGGADIDLPVLSDGVTFNTGEPDITKVKLTTGKTWDAISEAGDPDISFDVASVAGAVADLFMTKAGSSTDVTIDGISYEAQGYTADPVEVKGGLYLRSKDRSSAIFLPNIEAYANLVNEDGKPAYFHLDVTPLADTTNGAQMYILRKKTSTSGE